MKSIINRVIIFILFLLNISTMFLNWIDIEGVSYQQGSVVLTRNLYLSCFIIAVFSISLIFYGKAKKVFFISGLCSASMLAALEISYSEHSGLFDFSYAIGIGMYLGVLTVILLICGYIFLLRKETFSPQNR